MFNQKIKMLLIFVFTVLLLLVTEKTSASAIPMWEFLSKQEKMSYLYSMFANQVDDYCAKSNNRMIVASSSSVIGKDSADDTNCNRQLLKYGLNKLKDMPEDHLDKIDPYQRNANNIIWRSMMAGHELMLTTTDTPLTSRRRNGSTPKPNSYEDDIFGDNNNENDDDDYTNNSDIGSQAAASAKIDTNVYRVPPPKGFVVVVAPTASPQENKQQYYHHSAISSGRPQYVEFNRHHHINNNNNNNKYKDAPLTGPMVVKVYPDGRPVIEEPYKPLPYDEDLRQYRLSKVKIPNF